MEEKIRELEKRLKIAEIPYEVIIPDNPDFSPRLIFEMPAGRDSHECIVRFKDEYLDQVLASEFESFKFIKGFEAIWSRDKKIIEAEINSTDVSPRFLFDRLTRLINKTEENEEEDKKEIILPSISNIGVTIGFCSNEFAVLSGCRVQGLRRLSSRRISIKLHNTSTQTHDSSRNLLEKIANSIFFHIDLSFELSANLQPQRERHFERRMLQIRKRLFVDEDATFSEPKYEYDPEPMSLYWYAKESKNMPIFQYIAYYQTIEFYFPIYYSFEAKQKIQGLIKDPRFNVNKDTDISKIISIMRPYGGNKTFGNEKEQLKATITACTDNNELRSFFEIEKKRQLFFAQHKGKKIAKQKITLNNETADLIAEVSERIYEIRCRIVHTKASRGEFEILLPYSNEAKKLTYDIELIEFISRKVLITSSRPIRL